MVTQMICFRLYGRLGHFLKAEAGASALSYMLPPRTAILGLMGAVLGFEKDTPQSELEPALIAISGKLPITTWHKAKFRKDPPESLPRIIKSNQKQEKITKPEEATLIYQEWLFNPDYKIFVHVKEPHFTSLVDRIRRRKWHYQPCLGISEMPADIQLIDICSATSLPDGEYEIQSVIPQNNIKLNMENIFSSALTLHSIRMPYSLTVDRRFSHRDYFFERDAKPIPVRTENALRFGSCDVMLL